MLASRREGSSAGELIPELDTRGLQQLIELELVAFRGASWHERTEERLGHRNGYRPRTPTPTWVVRVGLRLACSFRQAISRSQSLASSFFDGTKC